MNVLSMFVVCDHPSDHPHHFTVRRHDIGPGGATLVDPNFLMLSEDLELLRSELFNMGLVRLMRDPADDPVIIETWL